MGHSWSKLYPRINQWELKVNPLRMMRRNTCNPVQLNGCIGESLNNFEEIFSCPKSESSPQNRLNFLDMCSCGGSCVTQG